MNAGELKEERKELFEKLLELMEQYKKNQYVGEVRCLAEVL